MAVKNQDISNIQKQFTKSCYELNTFNLQLQHRSHKLASGENVMKSFARKSKHSMVKKNQQKKSKVTAAIQRLC